MPRARIVSGQRFQPEALLYKLNGLTLSDFYQLPIRDALDFIAKFEVGRAVLSAPRRETKPRRGEDTASYPAARFSERIFR